MRLRWPLVVLFTLAGPLLHGVAAAAQEDGLRIDDVNDDDYPYVEVTVTVPAQLEDFRLPKEAFAVTEDGQDRPRPTLGNTPDDEEPVPPRAVLVIDVSGSMRADITDARDAAERFVQSLPRDSEVAILTFGDDVDVVLDFTADVEQMRTTIQDIAVDEQASTALYDGVIRAADLLPTRADTPTSIIVLSDGGDRASTATRAEAVRRLRQRDATVWAVGLETGESDPETLDALAGDSGDVLTADATDLDGIYQNLASDLSRRYLLRYESTASGRTDIGVAVNHATVRSNDTTIIDIDGTPAPADDRANPVAPPQVFTVALPALGTTTAYTAGVITIALGSLLLWLVVLAPRPPRTRERLLPNHTSRARPRLSGLAEWTTDMAERNLRDRKLGRRIDRQLEGAGLDLRAGEVVVIVVSLMVVAFAVGTAASGVPLGVLLAALPPLATRVVLSMRRDRRRAAFADQLTDVLQLISGTLRAGYGLLQGIDAVGRDAEEPAAGEFRRVLIEHRLGRDLNDALQTCAVRMDNADFAWVVQAIGIHRDVGGDLARILDNIIATVRERGEVHRQVRAMSAEGRMSALVLTGLPIAVLVAIQIISPEYFGDMLTRPVGWLMLAVSAVLLLTGAVWIRRMVRIRY